MIAHELSPRQLAHRPPCSMSQHKRRVWRATSLPTLAFFFVFLFFWLSLPLFLPCLNTTFQSSVLPPWGDTIYGQNEYAKLGFMNPDLLILHALRTYYRVPTCYLFKLYTSLPHIFPTRAPYTVWTGTSGTTARIYSLPWSVPRSTSSSGAREEKGFVKLTCLGEEGKRSLCICVVRANAGDRARSAERKGR